MSREIKFRCWDKKEKKMIYSFPYDNLKIEHFYLRCDVLQYTGLKDKNGKEVWEGDIVKVQGVTREAIGEVVYNQKHGAFIYSGEEITVGSNTISFVNHSSRFFEVIGNIYENPELLEATND